MARKATGRPNGRPATSAPKDPHGLSYYIRRAEDLLAGLTDTKEGLTLDDRAMLERHLERAREIAPKPNPLTISEKRVIHTFVEIVGALGPRLQTLRDRAKNSSAAKARAIRTERKGFTFIDALITKHCQPGVTGTAARPRINADLKAQKRKPISARVLYSRPAWKKKRPSNRKSKNKTTV
jgi:hypothetical protein